MYLQEKLQSGVAEFSLSLAMGRANIIPETPVRVSGFKAAIDAQDWIVSKVTHNLSNGGFTKVLEFEVFFPIGIMIYLSCRKSANADFLHETD